MSIKAFFISIFASFMFTSIFIRLLPGGDGDLKIVLGIAVFIVGEIAFCTSTIIKKLDELGNKHTD